MKFDIIVSNPPYNKGMDLDFIDLSYKISKNLVCVINPAKWQSTSDDYRGCASQNIDYKEFRREYTKHMSTVCFYPCCKDVFDILQVDGITYFIMDKKVHEKSIVINKCKYISEFNSTEIRAITNRETLNNIGNEIINYLGDYKNFKFPRVYNRKYEVWTNRQIPGGGLATLISPTKRMFVGDSIIEENIGINIEHSTSTQCTYSADTVAECNYFISWLSCKFTQFFVAINLSKLNSTLTNDCFRFVPAPPTEEFNHIFTDEELYEYYKLPQKYIDVIESIVKGRM
jgi:hypothetical protein